MTASALIVVLAVGIYVLRISGFILAGSSISPTWERALTFVPVATLSALVVSSLAARPDEAPIRLLATATAGLVAVRTGSAWACIVAGLAVYWAAGMV